ncbi:zinc finger homeobox protein 3-like [Apostichopus japonicus]|uniref:zinc finger homeobox protein 3-like n=1 Tax=Stichopus japonicus TaxID=307972 RepID=UPI003AB8F54C
MAASNQEPCTVEETDYITNGKLTVDNIPDVKINQKDSALLNHVKVATKKLSSDQNEFKVNGNSLNFSPLYEQGDGSDDHHNGTDPPGEETNKSESNGRVVTCSYCMQQFDHLQVYMEHKCPGKEGTGTMPDQTDEECEGSDMESFQGEILYQEDGSAYLVDNSNLPNNADNALKLYQNALGVTPTSSASSTINRLVNALHIPTYMTMRNLSQLNISLQGPYGTPMVHSFRVYDVRNKESEEDTKDEISSSKHTDGDKPKEDAQLTPGEFSGKPILMCFLCKLSFGFAKSFLAHATQEHQIELHQEEKEIMSTKAQSAIIQGIEKEPLLSFLELITTKAQKSEPYVRPASEGGYMPQFLTSSATTSSGYGYPMSVAISTTSPSVITSTKATSNAAQSVLLSPSIELNRTGEEESKAPGTQPERGLGRNSPSDQHLKYPPSKSEQITSGSELDSKDQDALNNAEINQDGKWETVASANEHQECVHEREHNLMGDDTGVRDSSPRVNGEASSPESFPKDQTEGDGFEVGISEHAGCSGDKNCNVECPKCDAVLSSSRSLGGHMTMMHSRNSCKTLKCPKCNWHYKYQQTLEAHMKEKHPEDETKCVYCENQEAHPRLSRGESYTCGYKPYRCGICNYSTTTKGNLSIHMQSDKHLNNVQELQTGGEHNYLQTKLCDLAAITKPKQKQTWRCEACDYETSVARNLNIHMTSQKHIQNMMTIHQNVSQMQRELQANLANISPDESLYVAMTQNMIPMMAPGMSEQTASAVDIQQLMANYQYDPITYGAMMNQLAMSGINPLEMVEEANVSNVPDDPTKDEPLSLFHCAVCNRFSTDSFEALFHHVQKDRSEPNTHLWKMVIGDTQQCTLCNYSTQVKANFQLHLKTDKHNQKLNLFNHIREGGKQNEWRLKYMNVGNPVQVRCNACDFYTHSVDKLCSHCHPNNFRHETNMKLFRHLQKIKITYNVVSKSFRCPMCNFVTKNKLSLVQHVQSQHHVDNETQPGNQKADSRPSSQPSSSTESTTTEAALDLSKKEPSTDKKKDKEAQETPTENAPSPAEDEGTAKLMKMFSQFSLPTPEIPDGPQIITCPYCKFSSVDHQHMAEHVVTQHSLKPQPLLRCPLCQEICTNRINLEVHLLDVHSVTRDCISSLLRNVEPNDWNSQPSTSNEAADLPEKKVKEETSEKPPTPEVKSSIPEEKEPDCIDLAKGGPFPEADAAELYRCQNCHKKFASIDLLYTHQEKVCPLTEQDTPRGPGFLCWKRGCNQYFKSPAGLRTHFKEIHSKPKVPTYNITAYKFKCSQCTLAFKTRDKLMEHDRTHSMIKCIACQKSFPSPSVLRIHIDTVHSELSKTDLLQYYNTIPRIREALGAPIEEAAPSPPLTPKMVEAKTSDSCPIDDGVSSQKELAKGLAKEDMTDDHSEPVVPDEDSYYDPAKKYKCHRCIIGFARQSERTKHERTLQHKNEQNYMMDRYFDPKRPFKCDLCRESFTQKSILLSHLNSVSHLHKLKQSMNEPGDPDAEYLPGETKPYRCKLCKVSYSTHTTLDTHFRSVLHQSRANKRDTHGGNGLPHNTDSPRQEDPAETKDTAADSSRTTTPMNDSQQKQLQAQLQQHAQMQAQQAHFQQLQFQQLAQMQSYQQAYLQQQIAHLTGNTSAAMDPSAMLSPELAMMAMAAGFPPSLYHPMAVSVPTCSVCAAQFQTQEALTQHHQQAHGIKKTSSETASTTNPEPTPPVSTAPVTAPSADGIPVKRKRSSAVQRKLLASYGFDLVQQFNEFAQGLPQSIAAEDKFRCKDCPKEFSSIWVFKAHVEEMHKQLLDINKVEEYALVFRDELREEIDEGEPEGKITIKKEKIDIENNSRPSSVDLKRKSPATEDSKSTPPPKSMTPKEETLKAMEKLQEQASNPLMPPPTQPPTQQMLLSNAYHMAVMQAMQPMQPFPVMQPAMHQLQASSTAMPPSQQMQFLDPNAAVPSRPGMKRGRTRISEDQLKVLKAYFNISNSPADDQIMEMSMKTGLPNKVIKHWFRNTLFKERQRNKDSPYNFNNPPTTSLTDVIETPKAEKDDTNDSHTETFAKSSTGMELKTNQQQMEEKLYKKPEPDRIKEALGAVQVQDDAAKREADKKKGERLANIIKAKIDTSKDQLPKASAPPPPSAPKVEQQSMAVAPVAEEEIIHDSKEKTDSDMLELPAIEKDNAERNADAMVCESKKRDSPHFAHSDEKPAEALDIATPKESGDEFETESPSVLTHGIKALCDQGIPFEVSSRKPSREALEDLYAFPGEKVVKDKRPKEHKDVPYRDLLKGAKEETKYDSKISRPPVSVSVSSTPTSSISDMASPLSSPVSPATYSMSAVSPPATTSSGSSNGSNTPSSRRSGRTRFTDYQIKVLQEFFETNAYPRDEDVEHLSRLLNLNGRVIVVWFQNARQKARKIFENQPPPDLSVDPGDEFRSRDSCLSYQCNRCGFIFQRFHDLIKHQKHLCTGSAAKAGSSQPLSASVSSKTREEGREPEKKVVEKVKEKEEVAIKKEPKTYQCEKCNINFASSEEWQEHQQMHLMNMGLFGSYFSGQQVPYMYMPYEDVNGLTPEKYMSFMNSSSGSLEEPSSKRKYSETSDGSDRGNDSDQHRDKRLRTTITPAQLDILYSKYQEDSNPTRRMLDMIAHEVGLKKRVVQVWFQNTRARERKGQFRISALQQARKCPFCDEMFKSKNAMETHARMRHFDQYSSKEQLEELISQAEPGLLSPHSDRAASTHSEEGFEGYTTLKGKARDHYLVISEDGDHFEYSRPHHEDGHESSRRDDAFTAEDESDKFGEGSDELDVYTSEISFDENASEGTSRETDIMSPTSSMVGEDLANSDRAPSEAGSLDRSEDSISNCDDAEQRQRLRECGKRYRTHMTQFQLKVLKHCFADYRTPIMQECELLGQEVGLPRRVVQVWFQNSRAKEKKVKSNVTKQFGLIGTASDGRPEMCTLCGVKYAGMMSVRDHIFTEQHIRNVKKKVRVEMEKIDKNDGRDETSSTMKTEIPTTTTEQLNKLPSNPHHASSSAGAPARVTSNPEGVAAAAQMQAMQAMQAHMMPPFPPQIPFPSSEEKKEERGSSNSKHSSGESSKTKEERKSEKTKSSSSSASSSHETKQASSSYGMLPNVSAGDAALMSYFYGGLAPYYAQMPMMYPVYPMGAEMFYAQDPTMQAAAAFSPHLLQAYAGNPLAMQQIQQMQQQIQAVSSKTGGKEQHHKAGSSSSSERKNSMSSIKEMELILKPNSSTNRYLCKRCEKVYTDLESVKSHQVTSCFLGQVVNIEETVEKLPSNRFLCQVCPKETLITDEDVLKHLHSFTHQQRAFLSQYELLSKPDTKKEK